MKIQMKPSNIICAAFLLLASLNPAHAAFVLDGEYTGNITATSLYLWRGQQLSDSAAVQGGVRYQDTTGIYLDYWTSTVTGGSELDFSFGYAGKTDTLKYDAGFKFYVFPQHGGRDFEEIYLGVKMGSLGAKISSSSQQGDYMEANFSLPVNTWDMVMTAGFYRVEDGEDYADMSVIYSKRLPIFNIHFTISDTNRSGDDFRSVISLSKDFLP